MLTYVMFVTRHNLCVSSFLTIKAPKKIGEFSLIIFAADFADQNIREILLMFYYQRK